MGFRDLLAFFTRLPVGKGDLLGAASSFYLVPLVGAVEGAIVSVVGYLVDMRSGPLMASLIMLAAHIVIGGSLHIDGLADYSDLWGSGARGADAIKIIKDPRRGSFSIMVVSLALLARFVLFDYLVSSPVVVTASYVSGLEASYVTALMGRREPYNGVAGPFVDSAKLRGHAVANAITYAVTLIALTAISPRAALTALAILVSFLMYLDSSHRLGFVNGDVLGATIELSELASMVVGVIV